MKTILTLALGMAIHLGANAQSHSQTIRKELKFSENTSTNVLQVANINGSIDVEGYNGSTIVVEAELQINTKRSQSLAAAKEAINVEVMDLKDTLILYNTQPCSEFVKYTEGDKDKPTWVYSLERNWSKKDGRCRNDLDYKIDYKIKVPRSINLILSAINNGDISVANSDGTLYCKNINGSIFLDNVSDVTYARTINGDVTMYFTSNPSRDAVFYSLNGDIRANYKKGLAVDFSFKSFNGELFTNLPNVEKLPLTVSLEDSKKSKGIAYKVEGKSMMRARGGGYYLDFETFNGDVFLKEN